MPRSTVSLTVASSPIPAWTLAPDGAFGDANPAWLAYTGHGDDAARGDGWLAAIHEEDRAVFRARLDAAAATGDARQVDVRLRRADGADRWHLVQLHPRPGGGWMATAIDIDDRRQEEEALLAREARARDLIENAGDIVYTLMLDGTITAANPAVERVLGYTPEEMLGQSIEDRLVPPDQLEVAHQALRRKLAGEDRSTYELEVAAKDGHRVALEISSRIARVDGQPVAIHGIARDITARKRADALLHVLAEAGRVLAMEIDVDARLQAVARLAVPSLADWCVVDLVEQGSDLRRVAVAHVDPAKLAMAEDIQRRYPPDPGARQGPYEVMRTGQSEIMSEIPDELVVAGAVDEEHLRLLREVGLRSYLCVPLVARGRALGALTFITAESGRLYGTEDLAIAEALAEPAALAIDNAQLYQRAQAAEARYRQVFAGVADAILVTDTTHRFHEVNPAASALLGYSRDELLAMRTEDILPAEPFWTQVDVDRFQVEGRWQGELELRRKDGGTVPVESMVTAVELPTGIAYLSALRDVTERHRLERLRRDFLAMVTHDLRTPLAAIKGSAQLLQRRGEYRASQIETILGASRNMQRLLDDLADVVRHETGTLVMRPAPTDLVALVESVANVAQEATESRRVRVVAPPAPLVGAWDRDRLSQVLANLLDNTLKHAPAGGEVLVVLEDRGDEVRMAVTDHGPGISPEHVTRLFDRFFRADATGAGGLGLGLYISRMLIEAHGGRIWVESEVGQGSTFTVALPKHAAGA